ncbi:uncharacterized protein LOC127839355 isoform X2 [Dreissena polymorpha]|uniref:uncharacterized protein LOC127839355 isoform X2 n=1 Tax=Dreissena polymorpha TaxID=45954 RepID=UPI0022642684|nr:uncharacterized protein LOC127839355 isoform X2 [Dreissena polymorpha]
MKMANVDNSSDEVDERRKSMFQAFADDLQKGSTSVDDEPDEHPLKERGFGVVVETLPEEYEVVLSALYGNVEDIITELADNKMSLLRNYTFVVAGEVIPYMNRFLNVLFGSDIFPPTSFRSPPVVCIHTLSSETEQYLEIQSANGSTKQYAVSSRKTFEGLLLQKLKKKECQRLDIYGHSPNFGSKTSVTIVVHPNDDLEKMFSFLADASMLIYVFNGATVEHGLEDKLKLLCKHLQNEDKKRDLNSFDPHQMMFVCSNWGAVEKEKGSAESVWQTFVTHVQEYFPGLSNDDHMFKLRDTLMEKNRRSSTSSQGDLETLCTAITTMISTSQMETIQRHYSWLASLMQLIRKHAHVRLSFAVNDTITKDVLLKEIEKWNELSDESNKMQIDLKQLARSRCTQMVVLLETHLKKSSVQNNIKSKFYAKKDLSLPSNHIDSIRSSVKTFIQTLILEEIEAWEQTSLHYQRTVRTIEEVFEEKCQKLRKAYLEVAHSNKLINESTSGINSGDEESHDIGDLTAGKKAIIAVTSPLWIPLGIVASMVAIPVVFGIMANDDRKLKQFKKDSSPFMDKWLQEALKDFVKRKSIDKCVLENYLSLLVTKIKNMCKHMVPVSMKADMLQLNLMLEDDRDSSEIFDEHFPIKSSVQDHIVLLRLFHSTFLANDTVNVFDIKDRSAFSNGHCSELYSARHCGKSVLLKYMKANSGELYAYFDHLDMLRRMQHDNIVSFIGVCFSDMMPAIVGGEEPEQMSSFRLMFMFEKCDRNLEEFLLNSPKLQCGNTEPASRKDALHFYSRTAQSICTGLLYIHGKGHWHGKISMENILFQNGTVKLISPSIGSHPKRVDFSRLMPPEIMASTTVGKETDIFHLGTLLWELWYGRKVPMVSTTASQSMSSFPHPSCTAKHAMPEVLARVVESCWQFNPEDRPAASKVLQEMFTIV